MTAAFIWFDRKSFVNSETKEEEKKNNNDVFITETQLETQIQLGIKWVIAYERSAVFLPLFIMSMSDWVSEWKIAIRSKWETWAIVDSVPRQSQVTYTCTMNNCDDNDDAHTIPFTQRILQIYHSHFIIRISGHNSRSKLNNIHNMLIVRQNAECNSH